MALKAKGMEVTTTSDRAPARHRSRTEPDSAVVPSRSVRSWRVRWTHQASSTASVMSTSRRFRLSSRSLRTPGIRYMRWAKGVWSPSEESTPTARITYQTHHWPASGRRRQRFSGRVKAAMRARMPT